MDSQQPDSQTDVDPTQIGPSTAILFGLGSLIIALLTVPPAFWHARNRNLGATVLVCWIVYFNFSNFLNAIIWPSSESLDRYDGSGLCDVQTKLQVAAQVGLPAALLCVLRALAAVMDTENVTLGRSKAQKIRNLTIDISWCTIPALLQMVFHYVNQPYRYYLYPVSGCVIAFERSIMSLLIIVPPLALTVLDSYYTVLILIRLYRYRVTFQAILAGSNTTKSRFLRLYILCIIFVIGFLPTQIYTFYLNSEQLVNSSYDWAKVHETISMIVVVAGASTIFWDRWVWLCTGILVFLFFGLGDEALTMYRTGLVAIGLARIFPGLHAGPSSRTNSNMPSQRGSILSNMNTRAKSLFTRKESTYSTNSDSLGSIDDDDSKTNFYPHNNNQAQSGSSRDVEQALPIRPPQPSKMNRFTSVFKKNKSPSRNSRNLRMSEVTHARQPEYGVMVQREVRQGSETAFELSSTTYPTGLPNMH